MNAKRCLGVLLAVVLAVPATTVATHTGMYGTTPVEHDDQGRGIEPDNQATGVLTGGNPLVNKVVNPQGSNAGGVADPFPLPMPDPPPGHSAYINPGCMGPGAVPQTGHNRLSGQCGLWTIGVGHPAAGAGVVPRHTIPPPASEMGRCFAEDPSERYPPGRFSGDSCPGNTIFMLDAIQHLCQSAASVYYIEMNRKIDDLPAPVSNSILGQDFITASTCIWAWYGVWQDKNGNGVIDHRAQFNTPDAQGNCNTPCDGVHTVADHFPDDEFIWYGNCKRFPSNPNPNSTASGYCRYDVEAAAGGATVLGGWFWPGNHHAYCGFAVTPTFTECFYAPADFPARQIWNWALAGVPFEDLDETDDLFTGDTLFGPQGGVRMDQEFGDRSGDPTLTTRQWVYGLGWASYMYDHSLLTSVVEVSAVGCQKGGASDYFLETCRFVDVDKFGTWSPLAESILASTVKPTLRNAWRLALTSVDPALTQVDAVQNHRTFSATDPLLGPIDDQQGYLGGSREPDSAGDSYPGAQFNAAGCIVPSADNAWDFTDGVRLHQGWCNNYDGYKAGYTAFADFGKGRTIHENRPVCVNAICPAGVAGGGVGYPGPQEAPADSPLVPVLLRESGDYRQTLGPGKWTFGGIAGTWWDQPHSWVEDILIPIPELGIQDGTYTTPPDGWVGNVVESTGTWYYRGYTDEDCGATDQPAWADLDDDGVPEGHSFAECHPYRDGAAGAPQATGIGTITSGVSGVTEWIGQCDNVDAGGNVPPPAGVPGAGALTLQPLDNDWDVPVLVWRNHASGIRVLTTTVPPSVQGLDIQQLDGTIGPIELRASCGSGSQAGGIGVADMLILPLGNLDEPIVATMTVRVGTQTVIMSEMYHAWGA